MAPPSLSAAPNPSCAGWLVGRRVWTLHGADETAIERVCELTGGFGVHSVLECVGTEDAMLTSVGVARPGGAVGRVGLPRYDTVLQAQPMFYGNVIIGGGPARMRAWIEELLPDVLEGRIEPGRVFDRAVGLDNVPDGYRAMNAKVMVNP